MIYLQQGRYREALTPMRRGVELGGYYDARIGALANAYARSGDRQTAMRLIEDMQRRAGKAK